MKGPSFETKPELGEMLTDEELTATFFTAECAAINPGRPRNRYADAVTLACRELRWRRTAPEWLTGVPDSPDFVLACVKEDKRRFIVRASYVRRFELEAGDWYYEGDDIGNAPEYSEELDEYYLAVRQQHGHLPEVCSAADGRGRVTPIPHAQRLATTPEG